MKQFGKSIRIFLKDGTVTGIKFGEVVNQTIQSVSCPRKRVNELSSYSESKRPGVYFLFGIDEMTGNMKAYIGESENVYDRLQNHVLNRDFWSEVVFFVSKDENLTKSHVKYLESRIVQTAKITKRYTIENSNQPPASSLPRADEDAMEEFLTYVKLLIGTLGHKLLEDLNPVGTKVEQEIKLSVQTESNQVINIERNFELFFNTKSLNATAVLTDEGLVVLANSESSKNHSEKIQAGYRELRESLINDGTLKPNGGKYFFKKNQLFYSPSAAASVIAGTSRNGREDWKDINGVSLKEIERMKFEKTDNF